MFYYLFQWLEGFGVPGSRLMDYITFRSGAAFILSLIVAMIFGRSIIRRLQKMQVGEIIRNLGLEGQMKKTGTPTMGGIIIILATVIPCLLVGRLGNVYMLLMLFTTLWLGTLGFCDDYLKIRRHNKDGMSGKFKIIGQVGLGLIVGVTMYASPSMVIRQNHEIINQTSNEIEEVVYETEDIKSTQTTIPFVKENNFDYAWLTDWMGDHAATGGWILFILVAIFIVTATSNGANLTDGLDGLAAGCSAIIAVALAIMAYLGGSVIYSSYLNIMYIPGSEELSVFCAAFIGALIGFLWYNAFPAQVFMGDTGSLTIGGVLAVLAILTHKELLLPILCGIFYVEDLSVMIQVAYFKFTKKRYGEGRRVFRMTPLHHHFQKEPVPGMEVRINSPSHAIPEPKIVTRFWIVCIFLAVITFVTLKIR